MISVKEKYFIKLLKVKYSDIDIDRYCNVYIGTNIL